MLIVNLLLFLVACLVLVTSGSLVVKSLAKITSFLRLSEFTVAFIIVAFATSVPELFVGIASGIAKNTALALGTIIGANIINLTLIVGITILLGRGVKIKSKKIKIDALYMVLITALPIILFSIGRMISRLDGIILLFAFSLYATRIFKERKKFTKKVENMVKRSDVVLTTFLFIFSIALLFFSAKFVVHYATLLSAALLLPPILVGLFLIAIGTTLPELIFQSRAILMGHPEMALGNLIGTVVINSTLVLGVTALIYPITANFLLFFVGAVFMMIVAFLFATFVESGSKLYIKEGISLILLYIFFIMIEFYIRGMSLG